MSKTTVKDVSTDPEPQHAGVAGPRALGGSRAFAILLLVTGAAGLLAAWVITIDKFKLLEAKVAGTSFTPAAA